MFYFSKQIKKPQLNLGVKCLGLMVSFNFGNIPMEVGDKTRKKLKLIEQITT